MSGEITGSAQVRFTVNKAGIQQLKQSPMSGKAMADIGNKILPRVMANGGRFTQDYKVSPATIDGVAGARLGTDYPFAHWDEWGNIHRPARAPLRRALGSLGLLSKLKEAPKP